MEPTRSVILAALLCATALPAQNFFVASTTLTFGSAGTANVRDFTLTRDELVGVFASDRAGGKGGYDLWTVTRASTGSPWSAPAPLIGINSDKDDDGPGLSANGLALYFSSDRAGGVGPRTLYRTTRPNRAQPWSTPTPVAAVNGALLHVRDPQPTDDGRWLFVSIKQTGGDYDLYVSKRPTASSGWPAPTRIDALSVTGSDDIGPGPEANGGILWFASDRPGGKGGQDLYVSWQDTGGVWRAPTAVADRNAPGDQDGIFVSASSLITYHNQQGLLGEIGCVCRPGSDVRTEGGANRTVLGNSGAAYATWTQPIVFSVGQDWSMGSTARMSYYDWQIVGRSGAAWLTLASASPLATPTALPFLDSGALAIDPTSMATLGITLMLGSGHGVQSLPVPVIPGGAGKTFWMQTFLVRPALGRIDASPAHPVTLR